MNLSPSRISLIKAFGKRECYRAKWLVISPDRILENAFLETQDGVVTGISKTAPRGSITDLGSGVILPALVNAHLHLELSALGNCLSFEKGFTAWVQDLLAKREALGKEKLRLAAQDAAGQLAHHGTGYVGEISTLGITRGILEHHGLGGVWFKECLGGDLPEIIAEKGRGLSFSMAGHAPHTTDPAVLRVLKEKTASHGLPFSIHLAESQVESEFIDGPKGEWAGFLASRGIDISAWPLGGKTPVQYMDSLGLLDSLTLGVHLLNVNHLDLEILADTGTRICLCPRSNANLHQKLPDIESMFLKGLAPALGTDSLASCGSISLFDEMAFVRKKYPQISPAAVLEMATINGASALGLDRFCGSLDKDKWSRFLYIDLNISKKNDLKESLTCNDF